MTSALTRSLLAALIVWTTPLSGMEVSADDGTPRVNDFAGSWEVSPVANRLLGYSGTERDERNTAFEHPVWFTLAVDEELEQSVTPEMHPEFERQLFATFLKRHNQRVVATGEVKWKFEFQETPTAGIPTSSSPIPRDPPSSGAVRPTSYFTAAGSR